MGSSSLPTLKITQNKFNKIKWTHKSQGRQREIKQIHLLARDKVIKSNRQCKDDQYIYTTRQSTNCSRTTCIWSYLFPGGILHINPRSSSQQEAYEKDKN
jgi:hypothetical protein